MFALRGEVGTFLEAGGAAGGEGGGVVFVAHFDPLVEHGLGFFFGARHGCSVCFSVKGERLNGRSVYFDVAGGERDANDGVGSRQRDLMKRMIISHGWNLERQ